MTTLIAYKYVSLNIVFIAQCMYITRTVLAAIARMSVYISVWTVGPRRGVNSINCAD